VADYFATFDTVSASNADTDLGSGGAMVFPDFVDAMGATRHLAVGAGKDGHMYVVDRDAMGKWNASTNQNYQDISGAIGGSVFSMPAYFNNTLYYGGSGAKLKAFAIASARVSPTAASSSATSFTFPGTTPSISASGSTGGIVWAVENKSPAVLHAYEATNLTHELYNSTQAANSRDAFGNGNKFITPMIVNGHVYVGTPTAWRCSVSCSPSPTRRPMSGSSADARHSNNRMDSPRRKFGAMFALFALLSDRNQLGCAMAIPLTLRAAALITIALTLGTSVVSPGRTPSTQPGDSSADPVPAAARMKSTYGKLPLSFEVNQGQSDGRVEFLARGQGYSLFPHGYRSSPQSALDGATRIPGRRRRAHAPRRR